MAFIVIILSISVFLGRLNFIFGRQCYGYNNLNEECLFCADGYYDQLFLQRIDNPNSILKISDCVLKTSVNFFDQRKVLIKNNECESCNLSTFNAVYSSIEEAFKAENFFMLENYVTEEHFFLQGGVHMHLKFINTYLI